MPARFVFRNVGVLLGSNMLSYLGFASLCLNPLHPSGDQRQISLCNIHAFSVREVRRIKDVVTRHEFR